jgi:hypothetical protein
VVQNPEITSHWKGKCYDCRRGRGLVFIVSVCTSSVRSTPVDADTARVILITIRNGRGPIWRPHAIDVDSATIIGNHSINASKNSGSTPTIGVQATEDPRQRLDVLRCSGRVSGSQLPQCAEDHEDRGTAVPQGRDDDCWEGGE